MKIPTEDFIDVTLAMEMMLEVVMGMVDMEFNNVANGVADMVLDMVEMDKNWMKMDNNECVN